MIRRFLHVAFSDKYSAYTFLGVIVAYLVFSYHYRAEQLFGIPLNWVSVSILVPIILIDGVKVAVESLVPKKYHEAKEDTSKVTVVIPTKDGADTLIPTLKQLVKRIDKNRIIIASNGSTDDTIAIAKRFGVRFMDIAKPIGKVAALNEAICLVKTPYTLIMDDDTLLGNAVIPTNVLDEGYDAAAFQVLPRKEGFLSVLQMHEYRKSMDIGRCFHNSTASVQSVSGAIGLFRTEELKRQIMLHSGEFSGEDLQRTLLVLACDDSKGVVITHSVVETFVPKTLLSLFHQRVFGWNPGYISNLRLYLHFIFSKRSPFRLRFEALFNIVIVTFMDPLRLLALPVLLFSPTYFLIFFVIYVILETIPYVAMGRKEPFWVVLAAPFFGLFNFLARISSFASFFFRRLSYFIARAEKYDDYRHAPLGVRLVSFFVTAGFFVTLMFAYSYFFVFPDADRENFERAVEEMNTNMVQ